MNKLPDAGYLLDQLLSSTTDSIYVKDTQSRFVTINKSCAIKHGWATPQEGIGKTDFDTFSREHAEAAYADEQRIIASGEPLMGIEERETWPDGRITWCSTTKIPLRDEDGTIIGIFGITRDITERKEAKLRAERYAEQIAAIKEEMEEDARMAGLLEHSFLLSEYPVFPEGADAEGRCIEFLHHLNKCNLVSGDYYSIKRLSAKTVGILLCDIQGSGARAALGAALIRGKMEEIELLADHPSDYLGRMNELLLPFLHPGDLLLQVSACYMVLDVSTGELQVASAGHPLPLHFRSGQPVKWLYENLVFRGPALAVDPQAKFRAITCRLQPGDSVVLFTDGLYTVKNARGEPYCEARLLGTASGLADKSLETMFSGLEKAAIAFSKSGHFTDDVCIVGFHLRKLMGT